MSDTHWRWLLTRSSVLSSSASSPQRCVLSPLLRCIQMSFRVVARPGVSSSLQMIPLLCPCAVMMSLDEFSDWCECSILDINVSKTKDVIKDGRKKSPPTSPVAIYHQAVKVIQLYKVSGDSNWRNVYLWTKHRAGSAKARGTFNFDCTFTRTFIFFPFNESVVYRVRRSVTTDPRSPFVQVASICLCMIFQEGEPTDWNTHWTPVLFGCSVMLCIAFFFPFSLFCFCVKLFVCWSVRWFHYCWRCNKVPCWRTVKNLDISYFVSKPVSLDFGGFGFCCLWVCCDAGSCRLQQTATPLISPSPIVAA